MVDPKQTRAKRDREAARKERQRLKLTRRQTRRTAPPPGEDHEDDE